MFSLLKRIIKGAFLRVYTWAVCQGLKYCGIGVRVLPNIYWRNKQYISLGNKCYIGPDCRIEAWDKYKDTQYAPEIILGNDVRINSTCHIGAIHRVIIKDQCLLGSHVMIIDHSHGKNSLEELSIHPSERDLYSKGEVIIGERVWLCENVVILQGVHIGDGAVIGANAVVTKDVPANCVAAGNPARIIKRMFTNNG